MHFQHPESRKNYTFRFFSNISRHGSCGYATKLQKQREIRIWPWSVYCATQLRVPADRTALSLNCFFRTNARNWMSVHEVRPRGQQKASENSILASKLTSMSTTRWYFMNGQRKFTTLKFSDSIWNSAQFIRSCVAQWTDQKSSFFDHILEAPLSHGHISTNLTWFQSARTDRKAAPLPRPTVRAALLVAPLLLLDFRGFAPNNTTKNQNF